MSVGAAKWLRFVEQELWRGSNCYIQMKPRLRLFYSAMICSFVPYLTREAYNYQTKLLGLEPLIKHTWMPHIALGALNGSLIVGLTLTT